MRAWIDVLTPKQVNFTEALAERMRARGYTPIITTRAYRDVEQLLHVRRLMARSLGNHGGGSREGKLVASASRVVKLADYIRRLKPGIAISFGSPDAARVAFGLGIDHYCVCDSPHAEAVLRLTLPLTDTLFSPRVIPTRIWKKFNPRLKVVTYNALDPIIWIRRWKPKFNALKELRLDPKRPTIVIRLAESQAAYLMDENRPIPAPKLIKAIKEELPGSQIVALPRYDGQYSELKKFRELIVPRNGVDGLALLRQSSVFIGAGGTMTTEAALVGVPTISCYPAEPTIVERYLISKGLVRRCDSLEGVVRAAKAALRDDRWRDHALAASRRLVRGMEDPIKVILSALPPA